MLTCALSQAALSNILLLKSFDCNVKAQLARGRKELSSSEYDGSYRFYCVGIRISHVHLSLFLFPFGFPLQDCMKSSVAGRGDENP